MASNRPKLFIAEDSAVAELYEIRYSDTYELVVAQDGRQARKLLSEHESFDLCLLDIVMPVEDAAQPASEAKNTGLRLLKIILEQRKSRRILVVTVRQEVEAEVRRMCEGRAACIVLHKKLGDSPVEESLARLLNDEVPV